MAEEIKCYKKLVPEFRIGLSKNTLGERESERQEIRSKALRKLYERKLIHYVSDIKNIDNILYKNENEKTMDKRKSVYVGIDLNCKYLHIGNLVPLITLNILRNHNTDVIVLLGGSTTKIGDPSFQQTERKRTMDEEISKNEKNIKSSILHFFLHKEVNEKEMNNMIEKSDSCGEDEFIFESKNKGSLIIVNNKTWYDKTNLIEFINFGQYFSIHKLLKKDCFQKKLENNNLNLKDLNYLILQSFDFFHLFKKYKTLIQIGGSDQWGNVQSGIEFTQSISNTQLYGLTTNLLLHKNNVKYSKSLFYQNKKLPIWIDPHNTPPFLFWNFLRNIDDQQVDSYVHMLTDLHLEICKWEQPNCSSSEQEQNNHMMEQSLYDIQINQAKEKLANFVTSYIYGDEAVHRIHKMSKLMKEKEFPVIKNVNDLKVFPFIQINKKDLHENIITIVQILRKLEIAETNKEAKEKLNQQCVFLNRNLVNSPNYRFTLDSSFVQAQDGTNYAILGMGKKTYYSIILK
ncbi:tyrosine--tRNA ligase [Plasmodium gonderi]|uniref:Tyrosine--tRNA ligase n=1 Tax=Plasmodium gonderi TaxID=77519 RepID=A0A1Y1JKK0_PLAGO|nr:tyrosine--tRNA ligase [Plasmodium gonderi]GAW80943.1 tyrosine--tRNA ligase [Plasmodium gonderi]